MVYNNTLTALQKDKKIPIIIKRDGNVCFYCKQPFIEQIPRLRRVVDHANNNPNDNRVENLLLAHKECNEEKKRNFDWQNLALDALRENTLNASESLNEREKKTDEDTLTEGQVNLIINKTVKSILDELLPDNSQNTVSYTQTLRAITYLVIDQTGGRGSESAVRRSIDAHCSKYAPWADKKLGKGNRIIFRRKDR